MITLQTDIASELLSGELAALETYKLAMTKVGIDRLAAELHRICANHEHAAAALRQFVRSEEVEATFDALFWDAFGYAMKRSTTLTGNPDALEALKLGEEQCAADYAYAVDEDNLTSDLRSLIRMRLLPQTQSHVATLERLLENQSSTFLFRRMRRFAQ